MYLFTQGLYLMPWEREGSVWGAERGGCLIERCTNLSGSVHCSSAFAYLHISGSKKQQRFRNAHTHTQSDLTSLPPSTVSLSSSKLFLVSSSSLLSQSELLREKVGEFPSLPLWWRSRVNRCSTLLLSRSVCELPAEWCLPLISYIC